MSPPDKEPTEHKPGSAEANRLAVIGPGACIGVAAIAAALSFLF